MNPTIDDRRPDPAAERTTSIGTVTRLRQTDIEALADLPARSVDSPLRRNIITEFATRPRRDEGPFGHSLGTVRVVILSSDSQLACVYDHLLQFRALIVFGLYRALRDHRRNC